MTSGWKVVQVEIENKDSIFSDIDIYKKDIYVWWTKKSKGNIERNWPDRFFWPVIESCKFSLFICEFSWHKLAYASSQAAMLSYCSIKITVLIVVKILEKHLWRSSIW